MNLLAFIFALTMFLAADFVRGKPAKLPEMGLCPRCDPRTGNETETNDRPKVAQDQEDVVFGERRAAYPHHGLTVEPQPLTMGAEDALDAYDVAQRETKDAAVTNEEEEST